MKTTFIIILFSLGLPIANACIVDITPIEPYSISNAIQQVIIDEGCEVSAKNADLKISFRESCFLSGAPTSRLQVWAQANMLQEEITINILNLYSGKNYRAIRSSSGIKEKVIKRIDHRIISAVKSLLSRAKEEL